MPVCPCESCKNENCDAEKCKKLREWQAQINLKNNLNVLTQQYKQRTGEDPLFS